MLIYSSMAKGNGAYIVHQVLSKHINNYYVEGYNPYWTLFPFLISSVTKFSQHPDIQHMPADYSYFLRNKNCPMLVTFHNYVLDPFMQAYSNVLQRIHYKTDLKLFTKLALKEADCVTAVSQFTADLIKTDLQYQDKIKVIYNGIDTELFTPKKSFSKREQFKVLFSGNLTLRKGAQWLPEIADKLPENVKIICATGLRTKISKQFNHPNIQFLEKVPYPKMPELYRSVDLLLMPTVREGHSLSILEAMSSGLPIVASNCSSIPEQVVHAKGGYLCDIGNTKQFADAIIRISQDREKKHAMGEFNRQRTIERYTLKQMIENYIELFETINRSTR